jgi:hypothetical protein
MQVNRSIEENLCTIINEDIDIEFKLEKCIEVLKENPKPNYDYRDHNKYYP